MSSMLWRKPHLSINSEIGIEFSDIEEFVKNLLKNNNNQYQQTRKDDDQKIIEKQGGYFWIIEFIVLL